MHFWSSFLDILWWWLTVFVFIAYLMAQFSIISDLFPRQRRSLPVSMVMTSGMVGASASFLIGAVIIDLIVGLMAAGHLATTLAPWRLTLIAVGLPGLLMAWWLRREVDATTQLSRAG